MNDVSMNQYGKILTDRTYGKDIAQKIIANASTPITLDFKGVFSLGSSCGDEILSAIHLMGQNEVKISGANNAIKLCLKKVALDLGMEVIF